MPIYMTVATDYNLSPLFSDYDADIATGEFFTWDVSSWDLTSWTSETEVGASANTLVWNVGDWNDGFWAGGLKINNAPRSVYGSGHALAVAFRYDMAGSAARDPVTKIYRFDLTYEPGEPF